MAPMTVFYLTLAGISALMVIIVLYAFFYGWITTLTPKWLHLPLTIMHSALFLILCVMSAVLFIGVIQSNQADAELQNEVEWSEEYSSTSNVTETPVDDGEKLLAAVEAEMEANPGIHHAEVVSVELLKSKSGVPPLNYDVAINYEDGSQVLYSWTDETMTHLQRTY